MPPRMIGMEYVALELRRALERAIRRFQPDIAHASFLLPCGQLVARQTLVPSIVTAHGVDAYKWPLLRPGLWRGSREAVAKAGAVTAVSRYIADCLQKLYPRKVHVIWNGADERFFYPRDRVGARQELDLPLDQRIVAFAGNLVPVKGLNDLVQAVHLMQPEHRPLLAIAGTGPEYEPLRRAAETLQVPMRFFGSLDSPGVGTLFGAADVVTLPSYAEGLPNIICEAMLSARAIVATDVGGIPEIVQHGKSGMLVAAGAPAQLSRALEQVLGRCRLLRFLGKRCARVRAAASHLASQRPGVRSTLSRSPRRERHAPSRRPTPYPKCSALKAAAVRTTLPGSAPPAAMLDATAAPPAYPPSVSSNSRRARFENGAAMPNVEAAATNSDGIR